MVSTPGDSPPRTATAWEASPHNRQNDPIVAGGPGRDLVTSVRSSESVHKAKESPRGERHGQPDRGCPTQPIATSEHVARGAARDETRARNDEANEPLGVAGSATGMVNVRKVRERRIDRSHVGGEAPGHGHEEAQGQLLAGAQSLLKAMQRGGKGAHGVEFARAIDDRPRSAGMTQAGLGGTMSQCCRVPATS